MTPEMKLAAPDEVTAEIELDNKGKDDKEWVTLAEAERLSGLLKTTIYNRVYNGGFGKKGVGWKKSDDGRTVLVSVDVLASQPPSIRSGRPMKPKQLKPVKQPKQQLAKGQVKKPMIKKAELVRLAQQQQQEQQQQQIENGLTNHINFAAGHCACWLENYSIRNGVPLGVLLDKVSRVLKDGAR